MQTELPLRIIPEYGRYIPVMNEIAGFSGMEFHMILSTEF